MSVIDLSGKVAIVTGGSRGIGAAAAIRLAEAGASVAITYRSDRRSAAATEKQLRRFGRPSLVLRADAASSTDVRRVVKKVISSWGRIDILVNNAGIWKKSPVRSMTGEEWDEMLDVNLKGIFLFTKEVIPFMKKRGGKIINISSTAGQRGEPYHSHYAASKGAAIAFTKSVAVELAPYNIQVNCVAPGWVDTVMSRSVLRNRSTRKAIEDTIPRGVVASADDIAGPILFLASDLSNHMIGATLSVNGGGVMAP